MRWKRVGVLMGGWSAERDISLLSGRAVAAGLRKAGFEVVEIDVGHEVDRQLRRADVEAVFIALHGRLGEDGAIQGMLELMGIPYTGSSVVASAIAMDKARAKVLLVAAGLDVVESISLFPGDPVDLPPDWGFPVVLKPNCEGSSFGVAIIRQAEQLNSGVRQTFRHADHVLVEPFVSGTEVTVTVLDGECWGSTEIATNREFYDFSAKYDDGGSQHHTPPRLTEDKIEQLGRLAEQAFVALGCSGCARVDFIVPESRPPVILEINTVPGMTETSLVPEVAAFRGVSFERFVEQLMDRAALHHQPAVVPKT